MILNETSLSLAVAIGAALANAVAMAWWAASVTARVRHVERWMTENDTLRERLARVETGVDDIKTTLHRLLDQRATSLAAGE